MEWTRREFLWVTGAAAAEILFVGRVAHGAEGAVTSSDLAATERALHELITTRALDSDDPWVLMHAVIALGRDARAHGELILDRVTRRWSESVTRGGKHYPAFPLGVEAHPNHFLQIMYQVGVPATRTFTTSSGTITRADLAAGARALFSPTIAGPELSWTVTVFTADMPPDQDRFENADGRTFSVKAVVAALAQAAELGYADTFAAMRGTKPYGRTALQGYPCNGTHVVGGLLDAVARGYDADGLGARVRALMQASVYRLEPETALIDREVGGSGAPLAALNADAAKLQLIGHVLENVTFAERHDLFVPSPLERRQLAAAERELAAITDRLVHVHDLDALAREVPRAYAVILGDVCHARDALVERRA
jgi:hypothetical protein